MKEVFKSLVDETSETVKDNVGDVRFENDKYYRYVQNNHGSDFAVGDSPVYDVALGNQYRNGVKQATTVTLEFQAGVFETLLPTTHFGWLLIDGDVAVVNISSVAHVVGDIVIAVNASSIGVKASSGGQDAGAVGTIVITNAATSAVPTAVVRCRMV